MRVGQNPYMWQTIHDLKIKKKSAQEDLNETILELNKSSIFNKFIRILKGYNNKLLYKYIENLNKFIIKSDELIKLWDDYVEINGNSTFNDNKNSTNTLLHMALCFYDESLSSKSNFKKNHLFINNSSITLELDLVIAVLTRKINIIKNKDEKKEYIVVPKITVDLVKKKKFNINEFILNSSD